MPTTSLLIRSQPQLDKILSSAESFIWPDKRVVDTESKTFFIYKAYPKQLKRSQITSWASLQCHALSPFQNGYHYYFLSAVGLHLWFSQTPIKGIPETAMQEKLNDGVHIVQGEQYIYQQTWLAGVLINNLTLSVKPESSALPINLSYRSPWAVPRHIDKQIKQPNNWLILTGFLAICATLWFLVGAGTLTVQRYRAEQHIASLQDSLGEKLATQAQIQNQQQNLSTLQSWHNEFGFLPESFAAIAEKISLQGEWKANAVSWQNRLLTIELSTHNIDIARLVAELESLPNLQQTNIRPHLAENTWIIEATVK